MLGLRAEAVAKPGFHKEVDKALTFTAGEKFKLWATLLGAMWMQIVDDTTTKIRNLFSKSPKDTPNDTTA